MSRSTRTLILLATIASLCLVVLPAVADTWDATAQYSKTANPNGTWSYGFSSTTSYSFTKYTATLDWGDWSAVHAWLNDDAPNSRVNFSDIAWDWWGYLPSIPILTAANANFYSIIRWTVPANGAYTVKALFRNGEWSAEYGHACDVHVRKNSANIWDGQTGTFLPLRFEPYADYYGVMTLTAGDTLDFIGHSGENANADIAADIKIASGSYVVSGHVQDASGVALSGVKVAVAGLAFAGEPVTGATSTYTVTDASGNYSFSLFDGSYTLAATKSPYTESDQPVTVSGPGTYTVNFTLTPTGIWNAKNDFSMAGNPNGNWSYGYATHNAEPMNTSSFQLHTNVDSFGYDNMYWAWWVWANSTKCYPGDLWGSPSYPYIGVNFGASNNFVMRPTGSLNNDTVSVLRWTAPSAGLYSFFGQFVNGMGTHTYGYSIVKNKTAVLVNNNALSGFSPNNVGAFNGYGSFTAGETLDFVAKTADADDNRGYLVFDGTVKPGAPGVTGVVKDAGNQPIAGAKVIATNGTESWNVTTAADGTYTIVMHAGTFSVTASKTGYDSATVSNIVIVNDLITTNFTLPTGAIISGQVTQDIPPAYPIVSGANIWTSDGQYVTTSDSAGNYSIQVTRGTYSITYAKLGLAPVTLVVNATANMTQNARLGIGWDLATDFTAANGNPNGPWTYGYATGSNGYTQSPDSLKYMDATSHWAANPNTESFWNKAGADPFFQWGTDPGSERPTIAKNITYQAIDTGGFLWYGPAAYREPQKVLFEESSAANIYSATRFTAPTSGYFHVLARFAGATQGAPYTRSKVALLYQNNYVFGGPGNVKQIDGFVGRAANGFTDSAGTGTAVYTYEFDADISMGERIDAIVFNDTDYGRYAKPAAGWTQVDLTVSKHSTTLVGRVTSTLAGNAPIAGATVIINGYATSATYQTLTDVNGYYVMSVRPDTYDIEFRASWCNTSPSGLTVVVPTGSTTTYNYQLTPSGRWNLADDFSGMANPIGQWSYGYLLGTAGPYPWKFQFVPFTHYGTILTTPGLTGWFDYPVWNTGWTVWFAKNTGTQAIPMLQNQPVYDCYIEPNHVSLGGGDAWYNGGPCVRWTAPDSRLVSINLTVAGQARAGMNGDITIMKNGLVTAEKTTQGFVGTASANFTDSIAPGGVATYATTITVEPGDTLDFAMGHVADWTYWQPCAGWPFRGHDLALTIGPPPANTHEASSIAGIKALSQGDTVIVTTPLQLGCATQADAGFNKAWGNPTPGSGYCFYVQNADRTQGLKCITDGTVPTYSTLWKITFTGSVDVQQGQKVVKIQSINSAVAGPGVKPIGKTGKSLAAANNGILVKVWGKITQMVANTGADNDKWQYEYIVINDGSQDVKIPMHVQYNYMAGDSGIVNLAIGHMVAVTGIAGTTTGSDLVVSPRNVYDIYDYTDMGRM